MRKLALFSSLLVLAACASTGTGGGNTTTPPLVDSQTTGQAILRTRTDVSAAVRIDAPIQRVYDLLPAIYTELGVTEVGRDPATRTVGNGRIAASRRFAGEPLSRYLQCGTTAFGGALADEARVEMALRSTVAADAQGTALQTTVTATARPNRGTGGDQVQCNSTGALEARIAAMVRQKLAS